LDVSLSLLRFPLACKHDWQKFPLNDCKCLQVIALRRSDPPYLESRLGVSWALIRILCASWRGRLRL